ncbi:SDR family NAD(P)-dependent oxidoreductase [Deinococcus sp.]|uniref:SDR family NAD(P)-dependent oxidoreductase n=1 Tax=Deinococcus sp. TaxID=47478 RepID=UPI003CC5500F
MAGKSVLITGASSGIGEAAARLLSGAGAEVIVLARRSEQLERLAAELRSRGAQASAYRLDLSQPETIAPLLARIAAAHPRIEIVICSAGKSVRRPGLQAGQRHDLERLLAVNFSGPAALVLALLPSVLARGGGQIINVSSVSAKSPGVPRWAAYQGSKAGFDLWLHSVCNEVRGVQASSVYLPLVHTPMSAPLYSSFPALTAHEAAQTIAYAIVERRNRTAPWWLFWQELAFLLSPAVTARALAWLERRIP